MATTRLERVQQELRDRGLGALLVGPSADLRYLVGYHALPLERLTLLVVPADADPTLLVPRLEAPRAAASRAASVVELRTWEEGHDPVSHVLDLLVGAQVAPDAALAVQDRLWARFLLQLQHALPDAAWVPGSEVTRPLRVVKSEDELRRLREVAHAIDRVHEQVPGLLRPGRTEREVARDITDRILEEHDEVNFVIVGSGPNGASPHHDVSDRPLASGDAVVVDIGGTLDDYCSDSTRNYVLGDPPDGYPELFAVLRAAQQAGVEAAAAGTTAEQVDRACRAIIADAGYGEFFVHRTGHGIGVEEHEDPYIVEGNAEPLAPGMCFSVEPGIYVPDRYGARIEDIVVATEGGGERLNTLSRDLVEVEV